MTDEKSQYSTMASPTKIPALGRPFRLGGLYDIRRDELMIGSDILPKEKEDLYITEQQHTSSECEMIASDSIADKTHAMDLEGSMKLNVLAGLVKLEGSSKYLQNTVQSKNTSRVTLQFKATNSFKELKLTSLFASSDEEKTRITTILNDQQCATHIVVGIMYGLQAFFIFDREVQKNESKKDIDGRLYGQVKIIPRIPEGEIGVKMNDTTDDFTNSFKCKFHGDFIPDQNPTTYREAVDLCQKLPGMIDKKGKTTVPFQVWLYPVSNLDVRSGMLFYDAGVGSVGDLENMMEEFQGYQTRCHDILAKQACQRCPAVHEQVTHFKELISRFIGKLQRELFTLLPKIRADGRAEKELSDLLAKRDKSPFNKRRLEDWMKMKHKDIDTLETLLDMLQNIPFQGSLQKICAQHDQVICCTIRVARRREKDPFLVDMSQFLNDKNHTEQACRSQPLFKTPHDATSLIKIAKRFVSFYEENKTSNNLTFVITEQDDGEGEDTPAVQVKFYREMMVTHEDFEPPGAPGIPAVAEQGGHGISWESPAEGQLYITGYELYYKEDNEQVTEWERTTTEGTKAVIGMINLRPDAHYLFKVRALFNDAVGPFSEVSQPINSVQAPNRTRRDANILWEKIRFCWTSVTGQVKFANHGTYLKSKGALSNEDFDRISTMHEKVKTNRKLLNMFWKSTDFDRIRTMQEKDQTNKMLLCMYCKSPESVFDFMTSLRQKCPQLAREIEAKHVDIPDDLVSSTQEGGASVNGMDDELRQMRAEELQVISVRTDELQKKEEEMTRQVVQMTVRTEELQKKEEEMTRQVVQMTVISVRTDELQKKEEEMTRQVVQMTVRTDELQTMEEEMTRQVVQMTERLDRTEQERQYMQLDLQKKETELRQKQQEMTQTVGQMRHELQKKEEEMTRTVIQMTDELQKKEEEMTRTVVQMTERLDRAEQEQQYMQHELDRTKQALERSQAVLKEIKDEKK